MTYLGLYAQQHRGQESAGIVSLHQGQHLSHKGSGLVGDVFSESHLDHLKGSAAIGHVRYSTTGLNEQTNIQPLMAQLFNGPVALAHNGNIVNSHVLRAQLKEQGAIFQGTNDTECLLHLLAKHPSNDIIRCLRETVPQLKGAFSLLLLTHDRLVAIRDPLGFRPLVLGTRPLEGGGVSYVVASETCAFDLIGAKFVREIEPGEIFWLDKDGEHSEGIAFDSSLTESSPSSVSEPIPASVSPPAVAESVTASSAASSLRVSGSPRTKTAKCVFEHVYFARPDSNVFGLSVYESRKAMGRQLAIESGVEADMVIPVPDSGVPAAIGYSAESGLPFELGIIRNHYIGRTFIQPSQSIRSFGVKIKLNPQSHVIRGKRVVVIDDSLVRGTTSQKIIRLIRQAGAKEVHFRIASPPTTGPCFYGVDTPKKSQLIAAQQSTEDIRRFIDADSLCYLSISGMLQAIGASQDEYCAACFDGRYPTELFGLDQEDSI